MLTPRTPTSVGNISARFLTFARPVPVTRTVERDDPVYLDAEGQETFEVTDLPVMIHATDPISGVLLYDDGDGTPTVEALDAEGAPYAPYMVQKTERRWVTEPRLDAAGNPKFDYADTRLNVEVLDQDGRVMDTIAFDESDIPDEAGMYLIMAMELYRAHRAQQWNILPNPE